MANSNDVFQKILQLPSDNVVTEDHNSNELRPLTDLNGSSSNLTSSSLTTSSDDGFGLVTSGADLLSQFSQSETDDASELEIERPRSLATSVGFELPPPKNTRRKLKLIKQQLKGFGFRLTTYRFTKEDGSMETSNFVSYVEDEGPAYIAGLRVGDVILEVDGKAVDDIDHKELTDLIRGFPQEMIVIVTYTNEGKKNELLVEIGNRQSKLRQLIREHERICVMERSVKKEDPRPQDGDVNADSGELDSESSGSTRSLSDELMSSYKKVVIWTSKFQKQNSDVLHSIQEMLFDGYSKGKRGHTIGPNSTTSTDLLYIYSSAAGLHDGENGAELSAALTGLKTSSSLDNFKRNNVNRTGSLDDRAFIVGSQGDRNRHATSTGSLGNDMQSYVRLRQDDHTGTPRTIERSKRHQSYKLAVDSGSLDFSQGKSIDYI